jgi:hypothetical protein
VSGAKVQYLKLAAIFILPGGYVIFKSLYHSLFIVNGSSKKAVILICSSGIFQRVLFS